MSLGVANGEAVATGCRVRVGDGKEVGVNVLVGVRYGVSGVEVAVGGRAQVGVAVGSAIGLEVPVGESTGVAVADGANLSAKRTTPRQ